MNLGLAIVLIIVALAVGLIGGFYGARAYKSSHEPYETSKQIVFLY